MITGTSSNARSHVRGRTMPSLSGCVCPRATSAVFNRGRSIDSRERSVNFQLYSSNSQNTLVAASWLLGALLRGREGFDDGSAERPRLQHLPRSRLQNRVRSPHRKPLVESIPRRQSIVAFWFQQIEDESPKSLAGT